MVTAPQAAPRLAARYPNCQTAFRVVADQLRLRGGLVRCGRYNHVFNDRDHLIELGAPPAPTAPTAEAPQSQQSPEHTARIAPLTTPAAPEPETPTARPAAEDDHGFGITLIWEEDIPEEGVAEVRLGEVEGATPAPDLQPTAPDTQPLPDEAPIERAAEPVAEPVQLAQPTGPPAPPADPFHGLPPIRDLEDEEDAFTVTVPRQPSADLPVEPAIVLPATPVVTASVPVAVASLKPVAEQHDSAWMRHETDPHTLFVSVLRRQGHTRRTQAEPAGPTPQRTLIGTPCPRKVRGPNHGASTATLDFLHAAQAREQTRKTTGRRAVAHVTIDLLAVAAVLQLLFLARAEIARRVPSTRPMLEALCQPLHCTIAPPRDLDALQIESPQLQRQEGDASNQYVLTVTLRNCAGGPIALSAIELVAIDLQDQLLPRRAPLPSDYLNPSDSAYSKSGLPARAELSIRARFQSQRPTANYRVLIFYP